MTERVCVLVAAAGAAWETTALPALASAGVVVLKRCVDLHDLMATASSGQADVALVAADLPGLDADAVMHLLRYDVRTLAVADDPASAERLARIGVVATVAPRADHTLVEAVTRAAEEGVVADPESDEEALPPLSDGSRGRIIAVWGPAGAPGRTTVAIALATERAKAGRQTILIDADAYGGAVAQHLGVLDEVSGILAAARLVNSGALEPDAFAGCRRRVADRFDVLTGLPRADRWIEIRAGVLDRVLDLAAEVADVVVDCGFCLEDEFDPGRPGGRNQMTLDALAAADEVVVVGTADPVGLARLARGLVELRETGPASVRVVVNRMRSTLGWSERDISGMVEGYLRPLGIHFLPDDRPLLDRALVSGRSLAELGDSPLRKALAGVQTAAFGAPA
ncbi:MAG: hypothetical protein JWR35_2288 [Marmoricola sp.]|jgi:MinD-like ATPase involved in chromosome partitioning or flagellar assembly|nr:hypothetical protein [Marmoricola sp.]